MTDAQRAFLLVCRDNPEYQCERYYRAAWPLYRVTGAMHISVEEAIQPLYHMLLRAIALGVDTIDALIRDLRLDESDAVAFAMDLQQQDLVDQVFNEDVVRFTLTLEGTSLLEQGGIRSIPMIDTFQLHYDPLSRVLGPLKTDAVRGNNKERRKDPPLRHGNPHPIVTIGEVDKIRDALSNPSILYLIETPRNVPEYIDGIDIFLLRNRSDGVKIVRVYRKGEFLAKESMTLQSAYDTDKDIISIDATFTEPMPTDFGADLAGTLADDARRAVACLLDEIQIGRDIAIKTDDTRTQPEIVADVYVSDLRTRLDAARQQREVLLTSLKDALGYPVDIKSASHCRQLIMEAFKEAEQNAPQAEVQIISPRLSSKVVDEALRDQVRTLLAREMYVTVGYDFRYDDPDQSTRKEHWHAGTIIKSLGPLDTHQSTFLLTNDVGPISESLLVVPGRLAVVANFDILSFTDHIGGGHTPHVCMVFRDLDTVAAITRHAKRLLHRE